MAFNEKELVGNVGDALFMYRTDDALADVEADGYFAANSREVVTQPFTANECVLVQASDGVGLLLIDGANPSGVITARYGMT